MRFENLESWLAYCRTSPPPGNRDTAIVGGSWASGTITPPPVSGDPAARTPLERADALIAEAEGLDSPDERRARLVSARQWLTAPHPRSPEALRSALRRRLRDVETLLHELNAG